jgi:hypothetical protein
MGIMLQTKWVYFKMISGLSRSDYMALFRAMSQLEFDQSSVEGFTGVERVGQLTSAVLVVRRQTSFTAFEEDKLCEQTVTYYQRIPFNVDLRYNTIEVFGGSRKANKVASLIGKLLSFKCPIEDLQFSQIGILNTLQDEGYRLKILRMTIENFSPTDGAQGRFSPRISHTPEGLALLREYKDAVTDAVYEVKSPNQIEFTLRVRKLGGLAVRVEDEEIGRTFEKIKEAILAKEKDYA